MVNSLPIIWQIAAGEAGRYYDSLFLKYDVMFMGPGNYGPFLEKRDEYYRKAEEGKGFTKHKANQIRSFCEDIKPGDIILLRKGYKVVSLGLAADCDYSWNPSFDDIYGWDLQHCRRVIWQHHLDEELANIQTRKDVLFAKRRQIPTFTRVNDKRVLDPISDLFQSVRERKIKETPQPLPETLSWEKVQEELFTSGLAFDKVNQVISVFKRLSGLGHWYWDYYEKTGRPSEHEIVAHMVIPLFHALGWSEQQMAVEWHKIDLAAFLDTPTIEENCQLVCEAKALWSGLQGALNQAKGYVEKHNLSECKRILVTDGLRFYLYRRQKTDWQESPVGYLNIEKIRTRHLAPAGTNAIDTILAFAPAGVARPVGI